MNWFHQLSSGELRAIVVVVTLLVSITARRHRAQVRQTTLHESLDNGAIAGLLAALIGIYAIAAGLTAVAVWGNTGDAAANVGREAAAITSCGTTCGGYPQPVRNETRTRGHGSTRGTHRQGDGRCTAGAAPSSRLLKWNGSRTACSLTSRATEGQKVLHAQTSARTTSCSRRGACGCRRWRTRRFRSSSGSSCCCSACSRSRRASCLRVRQLRAARDHHHPGGGADRAHPVFHRRDGSPVPGRLSRVRRALPRDLEKIMVPELGAK
jgi:hypothetical protein